MSCCESCCDIDFSCGGCKCCFPRKFYTKEEKIKMLEEYVESLEKELFAVKKHIEELKKDSV